MTKEEVKQEARQQDVAPEVRGAIRRRQFQQARRRMLAEVATADVVITNPTHFAVALRYDGTTPAPEVVAKGVDLVAQAIREEAAKHGVPVLTNPPLARALYREVELGPDDPGGVLRRRWPRCSRSSTAPPAARGVAAAGDRPPRCTAA